MSRDTAHVEIFDPATPAAPVTVLRVDFDPGRGHRRWRHRPAKEVIPWHEVDLGDGETLPKSVADALVTAFPDHRALVDRGERLGKTRGVGKATAVKIREWAAGQVAHDYAVAEAEGGSGDDQAHADHEPDEEALAALVARGLDDVLGEADEGDEDEGDDEDP